MRYGRLSKFFQIITFILFTVFFSIFFGSIEIIALENIPLKVPDFIPEGTIILDEQSFQEITYISPDQSVFVFRHSTPQLERLQSGDVLLINAIEDNALYLLFEIKHIIRGKSNDKGIFIEMMPWKNHPPVISGLVAQAYTLETNNRTNLTCYAADEDGDILHYIWMTTGGIIVGNGPSISWVAPDQTGNYNITCEVIDSSGDKNIKSVQLFVVKNMPLITSQEQELLNKYGWGVSKTIRWPDGYVEVYDATNFSRMQEVLNQWNQVIKGKVIFYLSDNPQSPVKITYNSELRRENLCGHIDTQWTSNRLYAAEITINPDGSFCGFPENSFGLYLHLFAGVVGFDAWKGITVERNDWQNFNLIADIMQRMISALYRVPAGYELNKGF